MHTPSLVNFQLGCRYAGSGEPDSRNLLLDSLVLIEMAAALFRFWASAGG